MTEELAKDTQSNASSDDEVVQVGATDVKKIVDVFQNLGDQLNKAVAGQATDVKKIVDVFQNLGDQLNNEIKEELPKIQSDIEHAVSDAYKEANKYLQGEKFWEKKHKDSFGVFQDDDFKLHCVQISQLLSEVWLGTEKGKKFQKDINGVNRKDDNSRFTLVEALNRAGIETIKNYVDYELDTSTYNGSLVPKEILDEGLHFIWYIPYAPCPAGQSMDMSDVKYWVDEQIPKWIEEYKNDESKSLAFPIPPNPYIPLATS